MSTALVEAGEEVEIELPSASMLTVRACALPLQADVCEWFPLLFSDRDESSESAVSSSGSSSVERSERAFEIVLIEDNPTDSFLIEQILRDAGIHFNLTAFADGELAASFFNSVAEGYRTCPDLVILDLNLPRISGSDLLAEIRRRQICDGMPVVIATSSAAPKDRARSAAAGATAYFVKPAQLSEYTRLSEIVRNLLRPKLP